MFGSPKEEREAEAGHMVEGQATTGVRAADEDVEDLPF